MQGHQGRRAGGVDGDRGALEPECVGDATRDHARGGAGHQVALGAVLRLSTGAVPGRGGADEDADLVAPQPPWFDPRAFEGFPGDFQQQPLLGIHGEGFPGADAEELGVEVARLVQEATSGDVGGSGSFGVRVVEGGDVPTPVSRELGDAVAALGDQLPQVVRVRDAAREPAGHSDDRDRFVRRDGVRHRR